MRLIAAWLCVIFLWHGEQAMAADRVSNGASTVIPREWLVEKISVEAAEVANPGVSDERVQRFPELAKPFGAKNREWQSLKAEMRPTDEIWTFATPADYWKNLAGRAGVALVRDGDPIKVVVTILN